MPGLKTTTYGTGDYSWMLNTDGLDQSVTGVLDVSTFTAGTHFPNGFFPSGLPVRIDDRDAIRPWADVAGAKLGFLKGDVKTRWEAYKAARESGALNADEIRKRENMKPIGGKAGEEYWRPANMAVSGEPNPTVTPPPQPQGE